MDFPMKLLPSYVMIASDVQFTNARQTWLRCFLGLKRVGQHLSFSSFRLKCAMCMTADVHANSS